MQRLVTIFNFALRLFGKPPMRIFNISCEWDEEAHVWSIVDSDVPGLVGEAATVEALGELLRCRIPELLELNEPPAVVQKMRAERSVTWELTARQRGQT